jgi:hypothetical protein
MEVIMQKRRLMAVLLLLAVTIALPASDLNEAFDCVYDGVYASVAAYFSVPRIHIDGISYENDASDLQVRKIAFNRVDLSKVLSSLRKDGQQMTWYQKLVDAASSSLSPIVAASVRSLEEGNYQTGDALLDGSIDFIYDGVYPFKNLLDLFVRNDWSNLAFSFTLSIIVSGRRFETPKVFEGEFDVTGAQNQKMKVECRSLRVNGVEYEVTPLIFSN